MNTFKKKALCSALFAASALVAGVDTANAVYVSDDGIGQVLLYPYYTVRSAPGDRKYDTLLSVTNTTDSVKAVKVRFLENQNSREVLDFNLFLSAKDVWTGAIVYTDKGGDASGVEVGGARLFSADKSCLLNRKSSDFFVESNMQSYFTSLAYKGGSVWAADGGPTEIDRVREGYFEIIEMATYDPVNTQVGRAVTHNQATGEPSCQIAQSVIEAETVAFREGMPPSGGLIGSSLLVSAADGTAYAVDPTVLDGFFDLTSTGTAQLVRPANPDEARFGGANRVNLYEVSGSIYPNFGDVWPKVASQIVSADSELNRTINYSNAVLTTTWPNTAAAFGAALVGNPDPVSAVLMRYSVLNEYAVDSSIGMSTDWVITMPTKFFYVGASIRSGATRLPFENVYDKGLSCDRFEAKLYNREEGSLFADDTIVSPRRVGSPISFCHEANVFKFGPANASLFGSRAGSRAGSAAPGKMSDYVPVSITALPKGENGWAEVTFLSDAANSLHVMRPLSAVVQRFGADGNPLPPERTNVTIKGLPIVGFAAYRTAPNGDKSVTGNYNTVLNHKYKRQFVRN